MQGEAHAGGDGGEEEAADDGAGNGAEVDVDVPLEVGGRGGSGCVGVVVRLG